MNLLSSKTITRPVIHSITSALRAAAEAGTRTMLVDLTASHLVAQGVLGSADGVTTLLAKPPTHFHGFIYVPAVAHAAAGVGVVCMPSGERASTWDVIAFHHLRILYHVDVMFVVFPMGNDLDVAHTWYMRGSNNVILLPHKAASSLNRTIVEHLVTCCSGDVPMFWGCIVGTGETDAQARKQGNATHAYILAKLALIYDAPAYNMRAGNLVTRVGDEAWERLLKLFTSGSHIHGDA